MTHGRIILFAGPSLPADACLPPTIELRPPARCGDLIAVASARPRAIALVDGRFEDAPTVWHKEIGWLLASGIPVYGAASLGALRAAELGSLGMVGVGRIHAAYRDGRIERDDAVMVLTAPPALGHRALTLALVDAEASIAAAALPVEARALLLKIVRSCNFRMRTWAAVFAAYADRAGAERARAVSAAIAAAAFSQKARDTAELIALLASGRIDPPTVAEPAPQTLFLRALIDRTSAGDRSMTDGHPRRG